jgi:hypothetical protein
MPRSDQGTPNRDRSGEAGQEHSINGSLCRTGTGAVQEHLAMNLAELGAASFVVDSAGRSKAKAASGPKPGDPWVHLMSRLVVLEGIASGILSLSLAAAQNDPTFGLTNALLKKISDDIEVALQQAPVAVQQEARVYRDALLDRVETEVPALRDASRPGPH